MVQSSPRRSLGEVNILSANKSRFCSAATHTASPTTALLLLYLSFSLSLSVVCNSSCLLLLLWDGQEEWSRVLEEGWVGLGRGVWGFDDNGGDDDNDDGCCCGWL